MKRALKIAGIAVGSVIGVVVLLLAVLLLVIDPNDYKPEISALVKKKTDMDLLIADRLEWTLWPSIGVALGKTSLTDTAAKETLVAVDKASVSVQLMPLLSKSIKIDAVNLDGARVRFIQHADGTTSWDRMLAKLASAPEEESEKVAFNIQKLDVKNTSVLIKDEKANIQRSVENVTIKASDIGMGNPFPLALAFTFRQDAADGKNLIAKTELETQLKLDQEKEIYDVTGLVLKTALSGTLMPEAPSATVKGDIHADMKAQQIKISALDVAAVYPAKGLSTPATVQINSDVLADLGKTLLSVNGLTVKASWPDAARPQALSAALASTLTTNWTDGALEVSQLALNAVVPDKAYPKPLQASYSGALKGNWKQGHFAIPQFVLDAAGVRTTGAVEASLPAMASSEADTKITKGMGISGSLATAAFNPRAVMAALGMAAPKTADASVLKSASFAAAIQGDEQKILLKNIRVKLDDSTLTGEAGISDLASLRQYARLTLDKLDADRYLPPAGAATKTAAPAAPASSEVLPVALLKTQNLDVALSAGSLKIMEYPVSSFRLAATAGNGLVNVSELKGTIFSGGFSVPATINVQGAQPVARLQPKLDHMEIGPLAKKLLKKDLLEGKASYTGDLTVRGNTVDAWMKSVSGSSDLKFENGLLHGVNAMKELTTALGKYQGLLALAGKDADTLAGKQNDTEIASFSADNTLSNGVLNSKAVNADLKKAKVAGSGTFNLVTQELDYRFSLNLDKSVSGDKAAAYALPVQCKGSLAGSLASLCKLDSKAIGDIALKAAAAKGLEKLGLKGLDGKAPDAAVKDKVDEEKQKAKDKLNEKLNEGLNKLFKR